MTGEKFGRLRVLGGGRGIKRRVIWTCLCDCGRTVELRTGHVKSNTSCGCYRDEQMRTVVQPMGRAAQTKHGHCVREGRSPEHESWRAMKSRCTNPHDKSYPWYGAIGVAVCDRWMDFENFLADMGPRPEGTTLGRIGDVGNYEPGNVTWEPKQSQVGSVNARRWAS